MVSACQVLRMTKLLFNTLRYSPADLFCFKKCPKMKNKLRTQTINLCIYTPRHLNVEHTRFFPQLAQKLQIPQLSNKLRVFPWQQNHHDHENTTWDIDMTAKSTILCALLSMKIDCGSVTSGVVTCKDYTTMWYSLLSV